MFRHTFPCASYAIFWHIALLHVANAALQDIADPQWRDYFLLCLNGYADLFVSFRVSEGIIKSLLSIALRLNIMTTAEAQALISRIHSSAMHHSNLEEVRPSFIVDLDLAVIDRSAAQLDTLCNSFDDLTIFKEFIATD